MILALAIVSGFTYSISEKLYSFMGHVHVVPYDETRSNSLTFSEPVFLDGALIKGIMQIPHVTAVSPFLEKPALVQAGGQMEGLVLKGINKQYQFLKGITLSGKIEFSDSAYSKQILLSQTTANRLNVNIRGYGATGFF